MKAALHAGVLKHIKAYDLRRDAAKGLAHVKMSSIECCTPLFDRMETINELAIHVTPNSRWKVRLHYSATSI